MKFQSDSVTIKNMDSYLSFAWFWNHFRRQLEAGFYYAKVHKYLLLKDYEIYKPNKRSLQSNTVSDLLNHLESFNFWTGAETKEYKGTLRAHQLP